MAGQAAGGDLRAALLITVWSLFGASTAPRPLHGWMRLLLVVCWFGGGASLLLAARRRSRRARAQ